MKKIIVIGGGTFYHVRNHMALAAPAFGTSARKIFSLLLGHLNLEEEDFQLELHLTRMAGNKKTMVWRRGSLSRSQTTNISPALETNDDISFLIDGLMADPEVKMIVFNPALCDYRGSVGDLVGKYAPRLKTREDKRVSIDCTPADKIISRIRSQRKDIFLVGFKTTCNANEADQYLEGLRLLKGSSCNLVLANDTGNRRNMIITPEEARYHVTENRDEALSNLVDMAMLRSQLTFTRTIMEEGALIPLTFSHLVPDSFRQVVEYCIEKNAYKTFNGKTVGHYGVKLDENKYLVSRRKNDHASSSDMIVTILTEDSVVAYGITTQGNWKPSAGAHTQRELFISNPQYDCVIHFHCPLKNDSLVPIVPQRAFECGSQECGLNTSRGMKVFGNLSAVYLDNHGPNVIFNKDIDPKEVIDFIESNFDLSGKTGGIIGEE